ncbi:MerR family DNA-binding protein [Streptomyces thermoviolaceus]|nr:MerR family DNA-binding protein [Streptomyces thermoviolaceus]
MPGARRGGGRRVWPATTIRRVALIKMAQRAGFTLAEITQLLAEDTTPSATRQWRDMATRKLPELEQGTSPLDHALEDRAERLRHHLRRPPLRSPSVTRTTPVTPARLTVPNCPPSSRSEVRRRHGASSVDRRSVLRVHSLERAG